MIRAFYGLQRNPFVAEDCPLLAQQQEIYDTLKVHSQQGGLCLVLGVPGSGKSRIKEQLRAQADHKRMLALSTPGINLRLRCFNEKCETYCTLSMRKSLAFPFVLPDRVQNRVQFGKNSQ